ncbi:hypothetical protein AVEN_91596-1 [Araneus ventricosus]|uniref:Uncharacterized protein n=1 Tax=Araneus ventricosus TaxID=182803 RepID=A0A4Y2NJK6_ARAVE|nr:hypothetical protein AVEN_91596-1 [Araneus ventricosus]
MVTFLAKVRAEGDSVPALLERESRDLKIEAASTSIGQWGCYPHKCRSQKRIRVAMKLHGIFNCHRMKRPKNKLFDLVNFVFREAPLEDFFLCGT